MTEAFPRCRVVASLVSRLTRDFQRYRSKRASRAIDAPISDDEADVLNSYEFYLHKLAEQSGLTGLKDACKDLAEVLGCEEKIVCEYFAGVFEECAQEPARGKRRREETSVSRRDGGLQVLFDLGDIVKREVEARIEVLKLRARRPEKKQCEAKTASPPQVDKEPPIPLKTKNAVDSPPKPPTPSAQMEVIDIETSETPVAVPPPPTIRTATIKSPFGGSVSIPYINEFDQIQLPSDWGFLAANDQGSNNTFSDLKQACRCSPLSNCKGDRLCPCAQFTAGCNQPASALYYSGSGAGKKLVAKISGKPHVYECSADCQCNKERCGLSFTNQALERKCVRRLVVVRAGKGDATWLLSTLDPIAKDEFVLEVTGEVISEADFHSREDPLIAYLSGSGRDATYLDSRLAGGFGRFLGHSCSPTCAVVRTHSGLKDARLARLLLFAVRPIRELEELTVHFEQLLPLRHRWKCECGAPSCKGFIGPS